MKPKSTIAFCVSLLVSLAAAGLLVGRFIGWIDVHWVTVVISCCVGGYSSYSLVKEFLRKPFVKDFHHGDWVIEDPTDRNSVYIKIDKRNHGAGNKPHYTFESVDPRYSTTFEVIDDKGNLTILHPHNNFTQPYKSFRIKII